MGVRVGTFLFLLLSAFSYVTAQNCLYNETMCACSFGTSAGSCYDFLTSTGGTTLCEKRACDPGWTCDCQGDYYCDQTDINVYALTDPNDYLLTTNVPCQVVAQRTITSSGFQVGYWYPQFSENGLLAQDCQIFAWWLDGTLQNDFTTTTPVTSDNVATVKASLSNWNSLPLRSGTVIGFRWKNAPYSCYNSISLLKINGTEVDTRDTTAVTHRFTNTYAEDWMAKDFVEGSDWQDPSSTTVTINADTYGVENTGVTNTYWRIKIL